MRIEKTTSDKDDYCKVKTEKWYSLSSSQNNPTSKQVVMLNIRTKNKWNYQTKLLFTFIGFNLHKNTGLSVCVMEMNLYSRCVNFYLTLVMMSM